MMRCGSGNRNWERKILTIFRLYISYIWIICHTMNARNNPSLDEALYWIGAVSEILWEGGILSNYITWYNDLTAKVSERQVFDGMLSIELSPLSSVNIPDIWIQRNKVYDCFIGAEKNPRFRFRIGNNEKVKQISSKKTQSTPHDEHIVHHDEAENLERKRAVHLPRQIHIRVSGVQTIWKREGMMHWVRSVVSKLPTKKK